MGGSVGNVAAFPSDHVMLNHLVEKMELVAKALPTSSIGSEEHEDLQLEERIGGMGGQIVTCLLPVGVIYHMGENLVVRRVGRWGKVTSAFQVSLVC